MQGLNEEKQNISTGTNNSCDSNKNAVKTINLGEAETYSDETNL